MATRTLIHLLFLILGAWMIVQLVTRFLGWPVTLLLVTCCGLTSLTIYMLRFERRRLTHVYRWPGAKQFIDLVCKVVRQQPPVDGEEHRGDEATIQLKEPVDFDWAAEKLKQRVRGHDHAIDAVIERLRKNLLLRKRVGTPAGQPPLAAFLFVGSEGIGKRHSAWELGRMLYRNAGRTVLNLRDFAGPDGTAALLGGAQQRGALLGPLKRQPYHLLVLENFDSVTPKTAEVLQTILTTGSCLDPASRTPVSFRHAVLVLTTTRIPRGLEKALDGATPDQRRQRLVDRLATEISLGRPLLAGIHEIVVFHQPDDLTRARVVLMLMQEECRRYRIRLEYVDPEIVTDEIAAYSEHHGFEFSKTRIAARLHEYLVKASENGLDRLVLTREMLLADNNLQETCS